MDSKWIPVTGRDVQQGFDTWINPAVVATATFWTDSGQRRVATVKLVTGEQFDLRENKAIDRVGQLTRGGGPTPDPEPEPIAASCGRRR